MSEPADPNDSKLDIFARSPRVAFRPERVFVDGQPERVLVDGQLDGDGDWIINDIVVEHQCMTCGETFEISETDPHWLTGRGPICPWDSLHGLRRDCPWRCTCVLCTRILDRALMQWTRRWNQIALRQRRAAQSTNKLIVRRARR